MIHNDHSATAVVLDSQMNAMRNKLHETKLFFHGVYLLKWKNLFIITNW